MAFNSNTQTNISFKRLSGLANTLNTKAVNEEAITSNISLSTQTIFAQPITNSPLFGYKLDGSNRSLGLYWNDGVVEKVRLPLYVMAGTNLGSSNSQGYYTSLPTSYSGISIYNSGTILYNTLGRLQVVPPAFSYNYTIDLLKADGTPIDALSPINWIFDYFNGLLFVQDPPANFDISSNKPAFVECFIYVAKFASEFITPINITSINRQTGTTQTLITGSTGLDFQIISSGNVHQFNIPTAGSGTTRGLLSLGDYNLFTSRLSNISGITAGGDLYGIYPNPVLNSITTGATVGSSTQIPVITYDNKGRILSSTTISVAVLNAISSLNSLTGTTQYLITGNTGLDFRIISSGSTHQFNIPTAASGITRGLLRGADFTSFNNKISQNQLNIFTGDLFGSGTTATTLTLNSITSGQTVGSSTQIPVITYDNKGRILSSTTVSISTGITLTYSSVTSALGYVPYNSTNPSNYISGNTVLSSTYNNLLIDSKGLVISGTNIQYLTSFTQTLQNSVFTGDLFGSGTTAVTLTLNSITSGQTVGSSTQIPVITYDDKGRIISSTTVSISTGITLTYSSVTSALGYVPYNSTNPSNYISGYTFNNGLILTGNTVQLGGSLIQDTFISGNSSLGLNVNNVQIGGSQVTLSGKTRLEVFGDITSTGLEWTSRVSAADNQWYSVTYGNGLFVAVSYNGVGNRVMTSPDGINWTLRVSPANNSWVSVCYGNGLFVAVSDLGTANDIMTSPDGINWTLRSSGINAYGYYSVCYGNGLFVAVSQNGTINDVLTSSDGIIWTLRTTPINGLWQSVCYGNGLFVAVSQSGAGNAVMTSPNGINWTIRTSVFNTYGWYSVCYGNGLFVAVSPSPLNGIMISPDGINWISKTFPGNGWLSVCYGNGLFVVVSQTGTGNRVMTSPDGINWTLRTSVADNNWFSITYGNGLFIAVAYSGIGNRVMTSGKQNVNLTLDPNFFTSGQTVGSSTQIPVITYDNKGRIISSTTVSTITTSTTLNSINNLTQGSQFLTTGSTGLDFQILSTGSTHQFNIPTASSGTTRGLLSGSDWNTFNNKQSALGYSPLSGNTVLSGIYNNLLIDSKGLVISGTNIQYLTSFTQTLQNSVFTGDLFGSGTTAVTLTLNSIITPGSIGSNTQIPVLTYDNKGRLTLVSSVTIATSASFSGITSINNQTNIFQTLITGSTGQDFNILSTSGIHQFNIPTANSGTTRGLLSGSDWTVFNTKQNTLGFIPYNSTNPNNYISGNTVQSGTYNTLLVDSKGLVISGTNIQYLTSFTQTLQNSVFTGDLFGSGTTAVTLTLNSITSGQTVGSSTQIPVITYDNKGRIVSSTTVNITTGLTSINNLTQGAQFLTTGSTGLDFQIISSGGTHQFNIPTASSGVTRGLLSGSDWTVFNSRLSSISGITASGDLTGFYPNPSVIWSNGNSVYDLRYIKSSIIGQPSGVTPLNTSGKIDTQYLPDSIIGSVHYKGTWNASTNVVTSGDPLLNGLPIPSATTGNTGYYFIVTSSGSTTIDGVSKWYVSDWIISDGQRWTKVDNSNLVTSINTLQGNIILTVVTSSTLQWSGSQLQIPVAASNNTGLITSTDWNTFNNKQNALGYTPLSGNTVLSGTYNNLLIDSKGLVISGTNIQYLTSFTQTLQNTVFTGDLFGSGTTAVTLTLNSITSGQTVGSGTQIPVITYDDKGRIVSSTSVSISTGITLTYSSVTSALGYVPYNSTNPNNYISGYTFNNGLSLSRNRVQLGGSLIQNTIINGNSSLGLNVNNIQIGGSQVTLSGRTRLEVFGDIASVGLEWTIRTGVTTNDWRSVTYGNGLFVAVSQSGTGNRVMTSPDGINWTNRVSASDNQWYSVCYGNGLFVAVSQTGAGNRVMTSPDGITWTSRVSATDNFWVSVCYGNGLFVAVSGSYSGNDVMTSPDGINWTLRTSAGLFGWTLITYGNGLFVAVGGDGSGNDVMTSPDGINWTSRATPFGLYWNSVTYGNGLFVAVGILYVSNSTALGSSIMTSPDGITWTSRTSSINNSWFSVCYGNGLFVAVQFDNASYVMTSPDGINWVLRATPFSSQYNSVCYGNGLFVALLQTNTVLNVMTSGKQNINLTPDPNFSTLAKTVGSGTQIPVITYDNKGRIISSTTVSTITTSTTLNSINNLTQSSQFLTTGNTGFDFQIISSGSTHQFNIPTASSGTTRGLLSGSDWSRFNSSVGISVSTVDSVKEFSIVGNTTGSTWEFIHNLNNRWISVSVLQKTSPYEVANPRVFATTLSSATVTWVGTLPAVGEDYYVKISAINKS